jgi:hypothetical protein
MQGVIQTSASCDGRSRRSTSSLLRNAARKGNLDCQLRLGSTKASGQKSFAASSDAGDSMMQIG